MESNNEVIKWKESQMNTKLKLGLLLGLGFVSNGFGAKAVDDARFMVYFMNAVGGPQFVEVHADEQTTYGQIVESVITHYGEKSDLAQVSNFGLSFKFAQGHPVHVKKHAEQIGGNMYELLKHQTQLSRVGYWPRLSVGYQPGKDS